MTTGWWTAPMPPGSSSRCRTVSRTARSKPTSAFKRMKVAVTGSSGLIGTALTASLRADRHQVVRLVRRPPRADGEHDASDKAITEVRWDPRAADAGDPALPGLDAVVHLAGAGVGDHRWTASYKAEIRASPGLATAALTGALVQAQPRPKAFITASAIGWYGDTGGHAVTE